MQEPSKTLLSNKAKFISFEGTEGVGKTTAINKLCQRLEQEGIDYVRTREPGGSNFAEGLREILLNPNTTIHDDTELLLMFTARSDHLQKIILPALAEGKWVVCDRFSDSSIAYQGYGRSHGNKAMLDKINSLIAGFVPKMPDLTIWLDLPVLEGIKRASKRSEADRFEQENVAFFERIYQGFEQIAIDEPKRFKRVNASGCSDELAKRIWKTIVTIH